jgi:hypothetical protein
MSIESENDLIKEKKIQKKDKNDNYGISDTICQIIIDKIISNVIVQSRINYIYSKINNHCFGFITNCIDTFLRIDFIFHETNQKNNNISEESISSFSNPEEKDNEIFLIEEPPTPELDRHHTIKTKIVHCPNLSIKNGILRNNLKRYSSKNMNEKTITTKVYTRSHKRLNTLRESFENENQFKNVNINIRKTKIFEGESKKETKKFVIKNNDSLNSLRKEKEKKDTSIIIELPCYDLPKEIYENKYIIMNNSEENNLLRLEKEKENVNKEQQKILEKMQKKKNMKKK